MGEKLNSKDRIRVSKNFHLDEFLDRRTYLEEKPHHRTRFIRSTMISTAQKLAQTFGTTIINNWAYTKTPVERQWSGYRSPLSDYYSRTSAHSFGEAIDCVFTQVTAQEAREYILKNRDAFPFISRLEKDVEWLHVDGLYTGQYSIVEFEPPKKVAKC